MKSRLLGAGLSGLLTCTLVSQPAAAETVTAAVRQSFTQHCSGATNLTALQQDRLLRFAAAAQRLLEQSGAPLAVVARSGQDLRRFGHRYSHAGISLREGAEVDWAVRQLYYACDEKRPRIFDQGLAGFVFGTDKPDLSFLSLLLLPPGAERQALLDTALDRPQAIRLAAQRYSANAFAYSTMYQNCNQWLIELLGAAWSLDGARPFDREAAQRSLQSLGYAPTATPVDSHLTMMAAGFIPLLHLDDHPEDERFGLRLRISMPSTIETFVRQRLPSTQRIELCQTEGRVIIRRDGTRPLTDSCQAEAGDELIELD